MANIPERRLDEADDSSHSHRTKVASEALSDREYTNIVIFKQEL